MSKDNIKNILREIGDASAKKYEWHRQNRSAMADFKADVKRFRTNPSATWTYNFTTEAGSGAFASDSKARYEVDIDFTLRKSPTTIGGIIAEVNFWADGDKDMKVTNRGEQYRVMATVTDIILSYINEVDQYWPIQYVNIAPKVEGDEHGNAMDSQRGRFYKAYIDKNLHKANKQYKTKVNSNSIDIVPK